MFKKKPFANNKYARIAFYAFVVIALAIAWDKFLTNPSATVRTIGQFFGFVIGIIQPFIIAFCIAYLIRPLVNFVQRLLFKTGLSPRVDRALSILISYVVVLGVIVFLSIRILPETIQSLMAFVSSLAEGLAAMQNGAEHLFEASDFLDGERLMPILNAAVNAINNFVDGLLPQTSSQLPSLIQNVAIQTITVVKGIFSGILSIFVSFYMLAEKEKTQSRLRTIGYALFPSSKVDALFYNAGRVDKIFQGFIVGKGLDSLIIGIIAMVGFAVLKAPYALLMAVVVGVTNMIPYFGPFMGAIPCVVITLFSGRPIQALWVLLFIVVLQQFDGNYLGPKILGQSTGLSPLWVIFAITVGGALFGVVGMFIGVPTCASIKLFVDEAIDRRYNRRQAAAQSPGQMVLQAAEAADPFSPEAEEAAGEPPAPKEDR